MASLCAPPDEGQQGQGVEHGQHEGRARVATEGAGQLGDAVGDEREAGDGLEAEQLNGQEGVMEGERGGPPGQHQEERPVGGGRVRPQRVDPRDVRARAQRAGAVVVRVDVAAHHLALGGVREHVLAEERRHHQERQDPQRQHVGQGTDGHATAGPEGLEEAVPDTDEEDHPAVDGDDAGQHQGGRRPVGLAEEPCAAHLQLEGRARQRCPDADGDDSEESQQRGPAQEGQVLGVAGLGLDTLGERDAAGEAELHGVGPHGEAAEPRADAVQNGG